MTQEKQEPASEQLRRKRILRQWLRTEDPGEVDELIAWLEELAETDIEIAETEAQGNGRPKTKKWVLLH